jgi:ATP-dependent exoDNAse (exonuclease V) beta subunit
MSKQLSEAITSKISKYNSINGRVDLLVVDKGKVYIYDFKVSRKDLKN